MPGRRTRADSAKGGQTVRTAVDAFLSSTRCANPNTRRAYVGALDRVSAVVGPQRPLAGVAGDELAAAMTGAWGSAAPATWNRNRAAVAAWLRWCDRNQIRGPALPAGVERRREPTDATRAVDRAALDRALSRRDVPLREKTLWRMLYETAARASEVLALNIEDLDLAGRRAAVRSKGGDTDWIYWGPGRPGCSRG